MQARVARAAGEPDASTSTARRRDSAVTSMLQPANDDGQQPTSSQTGTKSAIVTVRDRKTVQRQREQQQMAKLMQDEPKRSAIVGKSREPETTREEH